MRDTYQPLLQPKRVMSLTWQCRRTLRWSDLPAAYVPYGCASTIYRQLSSVELNGDSRGLSWFRVGVEKVPPSRGTGDDEHRVIQVDA